MGSWGIGNWGVGDWGLGTEELRNSQTSQLTDNFQLSVFNSRSSSPQIQEKKLSCFISIIIYFCREENPSS